MILTKHFVLLHYPRTEVEQMARACAEKARQKSSPAMKGSVRRGLVNITPYTSRKPFPRDCLPCRPSLSEEEICLSRNG